MDRTREPFRLGEWFVEPSINRLTRGEQTVRLEPRAMEVLVCLAERNGGLVTKRELIDRVWSAGTVSQGSLTGLVSHLRSALGDDSKSPQFIETIHTRGYRLVPGVMDRSMATRDRPREAGDDVGASEPLGWCGQADEEISSAEDGLLQAIELARANGTLCAELRSATRLAELWRDQGRLEDAVSVLRSIVDRCDDDETVALLKAKALLWDLSIES